jgi:lipoprotein-anchoring transpeptidase ErfK/SrfK
VPIAATFALTGNFAAAQQWQAPPQVYAVPPQQVHGGPQQQPYYAAPPQPYYAAAPQQPYYAAGPQQPYYAAVPQPQYYVAVPAQRPIAAIPDRDARADRGRGILQTLFGERGSRQEPPRAQEPIPEARDEPSEAAVAPPVEMASLVADPAPAADPMIEPPGYPVDPQFERQEVDYATHEAPGTIVIDTPNHFLYLVEGNGRAMRYGIGVGRPGFTWAGVRIVTSKKEWPDWVPPKEMLERQPQLPRFVGGGPTNPLGARAMYLGSTLYRIHGSNEPWTIGQNVSSGCIRLRNADVVDLYERVKVGAKVVVM